VSEPWRAFGLRSLAASSARTQLTTHSPLVAAMLADARRELARPLIGITSDGAVQAGLFSLSPTGVPTDAITDAALAFLELLTTEQRQRAIFPLDAEERRMWFNIHPNVMRHGLLLEDLDVRQRAAALVVMAATLSARGYAQARDIMRVNGLLVEITNRADDFGEWPYFLSFFGEPSRDQPWAWQLDGHHLNVNATVVGDHLLIAPTLMGSEPCRVDTGPLAGTALFAIEQDAGLALMRALDSAQFALAQRCPSILPGEIPPELSHPIDGRMVAGAFKDNAVVAPEGLRGDALSDGQRRLLRDLIGTYVGWQRDGHAALKMAEIDRHLDDTYLTWMGAVADDGPFYYRVHSPVVLIEFDHHPGIVFDNLEPSPNHIHTVVRTPNGGDYGVDLLRQHHERFDHTTGRHEPRR